MAFFQKDDSIRHILQQFIFACIPSKKEWAYYIIWFFQDLHALFRQTQDCAIQNEPKPAFARLRGSIFQKHIVITLPLYVAVVRFSPSHTLKKIRKYTCNPLPDML
ncbi:hypothetical protein CN246_00250 [Ethanoligenens harbinense]|nr:hypothetical protein CN246_00250 [Ethanoligenens harbinense]